MKLSLKFIKDPILISSILIAGLVYFLLENQNTKQITAYVFSNFVVTLILITVSVKMMKSNSIGSILFITIFAILLRKARKIHEMEGMENQSEQEKAVGNVMELRTEFINNMDKLAWKALQKEGPGGIVYIVKGFFSECPNIFVVCDIDKGKIMYGFGKDEKPENKKPLNLQELKQSLNEKCIKNKRFEDLEKFLVSFEPKLQQANQNQKKEKEETIKNIETENEENISKLKDQGIYGGELPDKPLQEIEKDGMEYIAEPIKVEKSEIGVETETETFLNYYPYGTTETNFIDGQTNVNCSSNCKKNKKQLLSSPCRGYGFFKGGMNAQGLSCPIPGYPGEKFGSPLE